MIPLRVRKTHPVDDLEESEVRVAALLEQVPAVRLRKSPFKVLKEARRPLLPKSLGFGERGLLLLLVVLPTRNRVMRIVNLRARFRTISLVMHERPRTSFTRSSNVRSNA